MIRRPKLSLPLERRVPPEREGGEGSQRDESVIRMPKLFFRLGRREGEGRGEGFPTVTSGRS
jgi:hypothetical protein